MSPPWPTMKRAYQEGAGFVVADELSVDSFRRRLRVAPITGALAVAVFGLALAPWFLRAICSISLVRNSEFAVNACSSDTNENTNKTDGCRELLCVFSKRRENFPENQKSNQCFKLLLLFAFFVWCPWPTTA